MKKWLVILLCVAPVLAWASIGDDTALDNSPQCVTVGDQAHFAMTIHFSSPDGERLIFAQFWTGNFWDVTAVQDPAAVDVTGAWSHVVNPAGNVISWSFAAQSGSGGDVGDGHSITFTFDATATQVDDLDVTMYIEGDTNGAAPHTKSWSFTYPLCADDDTTDDDAVDDDTVDDDAADDDAADDDGADDDAADDDAADDDASDDDISDDDSADDDASDDDVSDDDTIADDDLIDDDLADDDSVDDDAIDDDAAGDDSGGGGDNGGCGC